MIKIYYDRYLEKESLIKILQKSKKCIINYAGEECKTCGCIRTKEAKQICKECLNKRIEWIKND